MQKMVRGVCFFVFGVTIPLFAVSKKCSARLVQEGFASPLFSLKEEIEEVLKINVPLVSDVEQHEPETFKEGEAKFFELLEEIESNQTESSDEFWDGSRLLKPLSWEQLRDVFRYLNWYRFQQRQIQKKFRSQMVNFNDVPKLIDKFFDLEVDVDRLKSIIIRSHVRLAVAWAIRGKKRYPKIGLQDLISINIASIPTRIDFFEVSRQNKFSTLVSVKFFGNAKKLGFFVAAAKRTPEKSFVSMQKDGDDRDGLDKVEDPTINKAVKSLELKDLNSLIESELEGFIKDPILRKRFSMVYGLNGYAPYEAATVAKMEGVSRQTIQQLCDRTMKKIRPFLEGKKISAKLFQD